MLWYKTLVKPPLTPPVWIFSPAWIFLYITIFLALFNYIVKKSDKNKSWGYILFFSQLALNFCWSPVFFYIHNIGMAFAILITMDIFVIMTMIEFFRISKPAGFLLIPYLIWILFATYLNAGFFVLN